MPAYLKRRFDASRDLYVQSRGRGGEISHNLLPAGVVFDSELPGPVEISELTRRRRELARSDGIRNPTSKTAIHYGLVKTAEMHPLHLEDGEAAALIRMALFDASSIHAAPDPSFLQLVSDRILAWFEAHNHLSSGAFDRAFFPGKSNFIKAIADQPNCPGESLPHADVRQAILYLGWQSYEDVASCLARFASWFLESLPEPPSDAERQRYDEMYSPQSHFGNLPLVLLLERGGFIQKIVTDLWDRPGEKLLIGALHRLLDVYRQMAESRREADRRFKRRADDAGRVAREATNQDEIVGATLSRASNRIFDAVANVLAASAGLTCDWCGGDWTARVIDDEASAQLDSTVELAVLCECGRVAHHETMSLAEFRRLASRFIDSN